MHRACIPILSSSISQRSGLARCAGGAPSPPRLPAGAGSPEGAGSDGVRAAQAGGLQGEQGLPGRAVPRGGGGGAAGRRQREAVGSGGAWAGLLLAAGLQAGVLRPAAGGARPLRKDGLAQKQVRCALATLRAKTFCHNFPPPLFAGPTR